MIPKTRGTKHEAPIKETKSTNPSITFGPSSGPYILCFHLSDFDTIPFLMKRINSTWILSSLIANEAPLTRFLMTLMLYWWQPSLEPLVLPVSALSWTPPRIRALEFSLLKVPQLCICSANVAHWKKFYASIEFTSKAAIMKQSCLKSQWSRLNVSSKERWPWCTLLLSLTYGAQVVPVHIFQIININQ